MITKKIGLPIYFGRKWVLFFILLETFTVPLVAVSNGFAVKNIYYMSIMGFLVAFVVIWLLIRLLENLIIRHSPELFGIPVCKLSGGWHIAIFAGILEMIMFAVQDVLFRRGWDDYRVGFISALLSVGATLVLYRLMVQWFNSGIRFYSAGESYLFGFEWWDIFKLALLFACYEAIVCPITGLWIPYPDHRLSLGILSGILGGASGGVLLWGISHFIPVLQARFILRQCNPSGYNHGL